MWYALAHAVWGVITGRDLVSFTAEYSTWSGPITWIKVGGQNIKVAIDTTACFSRFWDEQYCPAFVDGGCFNASTSTVLVNDEWAGLKFTRVPIEFSTTGTIPGEIVALTDLRKWEYGLRTRGRDVAGVIGAGIDSMVFKDLVIQISDNAFPDPTTTFQELAPWSVPLWMVRFHEPRLALRSWAFEAKVASVSSEFDSWFTFKLDLGATDLFVPSRIRDQFLRRVFPDGCAWRIRADGRVEIPSTQAVDSIVISMLMDRGYMDVKIPIFFKESSSDVFIETRIMIVRSESNSIGIGRLLMTAVDSLVLDYKAKRLGIIPKQNGDRLVRSFVSRSPNVPVFSGEFILQDDENNMTFRRVEASSPDGVILRSETETSIRGLNLGESISCWVLERIYPDYSISSSIQMLSGSFDQIRFDHAEGDLRFMFDGYESSDLGKPNTGLLIIGPMNIAICRSEIVLYELADPGPLIEVTNTSNPLIGEVCAVCLEKYVAGDRIQSLSECGHSFHEDCVLEWVLENQNTCPMCRVEVKRIPVTTSPNP